MRLGNRRLGRTGQNPAVGCVLVRDHVVIGVGATDFGGRPHAETIALAQAKNAKGADAYVTLEPCAHHGQTPPCANALIEAGVARVICPFQDPDPRVSGQGFARLREAGIEVVHPRIDIPASLKPFLSMRKRARPYVTLKLAPSLDGQIALANGQSKWITGENTRRATRIMRADFDAIVVGSATVIADDPSLNIRQAGLDDFAPQPVILDTNLRTPETASIFKSSRPIIFHTKGAEADLPAELFEIEQEGAGLNLEAAFAKLGELGFSSILIEGGARLAASALRSGLVDEALIAHGAIFMGGDGKSAVSSLGIEIMECLPRMSLMSMRRIGDDVLAHYDAKTLTPSEFWP